MSTEVENRRKTGGAVRQGAAFFVDQALVDQAAAKADGDRVSAVLDWEGTHLGDPTVAVLARWPKIPYQHYSDNLKDDCYEFSDVPDVTRNNMPENIYNLCFKDGFLRTKDIL